MPETGGRKPPSKGSLPSRTLAARSDGCIATEEVGVANATRKLTPDSSSDGPTGGIAAGRADGGADADRCVLCGWRGSGGAITGPSDRR